MEKIIKDIGDLLGETVTKVDKSSDELIFTLENGKQYKFYHSQNCCEHVYIEDINGELNDLLNSPLTLAEESCSSENPEGVDMGSQYSFTWTFYRFATIKGYVNIRWYGESNGYYSESVDFCEVGSENDW